MESISNELKRDIVTGLIQDRSFLGTYQEYDGILNFLLMIWPLRDMPSEDTRVSNAYQDVNQHMVNNDDWELDFLFYKRFDVLEDKAFRKFIEAVVDPKVRGTGEGIRQYVNDINRKLNRTNLKLALIDYFEELPVYKLGNRESIKDLPNSIPVNQIQFYVEDYDGQRTYPCFELQADNWNDYGFRTLMRLMYFESATRFENLAYIKTMKRGESSTLDVLPKTFKTLDNTFCSLLQDESYYFDLKKKFPDTYQSILIALRDVALFPRIHHEFENDNIFKTSINRDNAQEKLIRTVRFVLQGENIAEYFKFNYLYKPPYSEDGINLNFDFAYANEYEQRIYSIIGKNGTGKTRLLSSLANDLSDEGNLNVISRKPKYGAILHISCSYFDSFEIPESDAAFNYIHIGLKKPDGSLITRSEMLIRCIESLYTMKESPNLLYTWGQIIENFLDPNILEDVLKDRFRDFNEEKFKALFNVFSSGQSILTYIFTVVVANIRNNSLILYDEPETHLHPNAIREVVNTLYSLVDNFESFCIIGTHSPIIVQEIPSRNVFVLNRINNAIDLSLLENESFGENLATITDEIFGNTEIPKHFLRVLRKMVNEGKSFEDIVVLLESNKLPMPLSTRLYIKGLIKLQDEKR